MTEEEIMDELVRLAMDWALGEEPCTGYFARPFEDFVFICFVYQYSCLMNFMEEEAVKFFSRFRETTSILREKLMFHHKTRFEKTCGSHARGLPQNGDVRMSLVHLLDCRTCF
jgi:hypothetical protein